MILGTPNCELRERVTRAQLRDSDKEILKAVYSFCGTAFFKNTPITYSEEPCPGGASCFYHGLSSLLLLLLGDFRGLTSYIRYSSCPSEAKSKKEIVDIEMDTARLRCRYAHAPLSLPQKLVMAFRSEFYRSFAETRVPEKMSAQTKECEALLSVDGGPGVQDGIRILIWRHIGADCLHPTYEVGRISNLSTITPVISTYRENNFARVGGRVARVDTTVVGKKQQLLTELLVLSTSEDTRGRGFRGSHREDTRGRGRGRGRGQYRRTGS